MTEEAFLAHIKRAQAELEAVKSISAEDRDLVGKTLTDIVAHLTEGEELDESAREHIADRLQRQVTELEAEHPALASVLARVVNLLSSIGI